MIKFNKFLSDFKAIILILTLLFSLPILSNSQSVTVNYSGSLLTPGSTITVPVIINDNSGAISIGGFELYLTWNTDVLTYTGYTLVDSRLTTTSSWTPPTTFGANADYKLFLGWGYAPALPPYYLTFNNQTIVNLSFTYHGGNTNISFYKNSDPDNGGSYLVDDAVAYLLPNNWYSQGQANGSLVNITSIANGNWSSSSIWDLGHIPNSSNANVTINNSTVVMDESPSITGDLTVNSNAALTINSGKTATISGNFLIKSDASGTGSFINNGSYTASNTTVERYLPAWPSTASTQGWHLISSPVSGQSISGTFTPSPATSYDFFAWGESALLWLDQKIPANGITAFQNGKGYLVSYQNAGTHNFSGNLFTSNVTPNFLTYTTTTVSTDNGVNLVGNPFTSALDASDINTANWPKTNVNSYVYVYDDATQNYLDWNGTTGNLPGGIIPSMQGFLICANGPSPSFTIPAAKRVHSSQNLYKSTINDLLKLSVLSSNGYSDNATIYFSNNNNNTLDANVDVPKQFGPGQESPNLYSYIGTKIYSTNAMGTLSNVTIPLGFEPKINGTFLIKASDYSTFPAGTSIILQDLKTGVSKNLMQNHVYSFTANTTDNVNRFNLIFSTTAGISENNATITNSIYSYGKDIFVDCSETTVKQIAIYNTIGQVVYTVNNPVGMFKHTLNGDNTTGYYIVRVITDKNVNSEKVFVK